MIFFIGILTYEVIDEVIRQVKGFLVDKDKVFAVSQKQGQRPRQRGANEGPCLCRRDGASPTRSLT
jgi:hypothetical protein